MYENESINGSSQKMIPFFRRDIRMLSERWEKVVENILINLYYINFFIVIRKLQNIDKNFCTIQ